MTRPERLLERLAERELDALLVTNLVNVRYLSGFRGTNGVCVVAPERREFVTDFRYVEQAGAQVDGFDVLRGKQDLLADVAGRLAGRVGFDDAHVSVRTHERLTELAEGRFELVPAGGLVEGLRAVKDAGEIEKIRESAKLADSIFAYVVERGLAGRTEREVAYDLEREMRARGAEDPSFDSIVAFGAHGALPHAEPRDVEIARDTLVVLDLGCRLDGYCSDCTRTVATGDAGGEMREVYDLVLSVQERALAAVRAGAGCRELDSLAREAIADAGHGERFGHGLGHGVGLEIHEEPRLSQAAEGELAAGNVVTVEPGVYVAGAFGVRIEDLVAVTADGPDVLSHFPKAFTVAGE